MPAPAMPAAAMPAAAMPAAKTVEKPAPAPAVTQVAMAPRKIGRSAVDAEPTPAVVDAQAQVSPAEEPKLEPAPEPAKTADAPKPEIKADDVVVDKVADKPADKPIDIARPQLDRATVSSVITTHRPQVLKCFADGKKKNAAMKGTLTLQLQVNAAGAVTRAQVQSTLNNPLVAACVVKAANTWKFPARAGGEVATVAYPFTIN
jgi:outer membrane biosynthesis protein TonB